MLCPILFIVGCRPFFLRMILIPSLTAFSSEDVSTPASLSNFYAMVEPQHKLAAIYGFLSNELSQNPEDPGKYMIFLATCACVSYFSTVLSR